jgi:hypothetical protein
MKAIQSLIVSRNKLSNEPAVLEGIGADASLGPRLTTEAFRLPVGLSMGRWGAIEAMADANSLPEPARGSDELTGDLLRRTAPATEGEFRVIRGRVFLERVRDLSQALD